MGQEKKERLLRINVVADRLGYSERHVRRLVRDAKISYIRESPRRTLIPEEALEAFRETHKENL
jgi:excisionase family DNA binding protein